MKSTKKIFALLLTLCMCIGLLSACSGGTDSTTAAATEGAAGETSGESAARDGRSRHGIWLRHSGCIQEPLRGQILSVLCCKC